MVLYNITQLHRSEFLRDRSRPERPAHHVHVDADRERQWRWSDATDNCLLAPFLLLPKEFFSFNFICLQTIVRNYTEELATIWATRNNPRPLYKPICGYSGKLFCLEFASGLNFFNSI